MNPAQVARALSYREFNTLCGMVDAFSMPKATMLVNGSVSYSVMPQVKERKFNVLKVQRELGRIYVQADLGRGFVRWFNFEIVKEKARAA